MVVDIISQSSAAGPHSGGPPGGPPKGPPYAPQIQSYGGLPAINPDISICAIYLFLYLVGAASHMYIFKANKKKGNLFIMSAMTFGKFASISVSSMALINEYRILYV
jgi:hypothetical protein